MKKDIRSGCIRSLCQKCPEWEVGDQRGKCVANLVVKNDKIMKNIIIIIPQEPVRTEVQVVCWARTIIFGST